MADDLREKRERPADSGTMLETFTPFLLRRIVNLMSADLTAALKPYGVNLTRWRILVVLDAHGASTVGEIARLTALAQPGISRAVEEMVNENLINRSAQPGDSRVSALRLTARGRALYADILPIAQAQESSLLAGLGESERQLLTGLLQRVLGNAEGRKG